MIVEKEITNLNKHIINTLSDNNNNIADDISDYLSSKSKRLRPLLVFLFAKAMDIEITDTIYSLASCVELIHNSTLVHDDILDNAETRRGKISLNYKLGNSLSVLAGDILLSVALKELVKCNNIDVVNTFANSLYIMCKGEINQNFSIGKIPTLEEYINKSEGKTAELYKAPLVSLTLLYDKTKKDAIYNFARNFGIAFQIKDDLINILKNDPTKPALSDIHNGIYTAPVIFLYEDNKNITDLKEDEIINLLQKDRKYITKTVELIKEYAEKAIEAISFIPDNLYKEEIIKYTENLYKEGINE